MCILKFSVAQLVPVMSECCEYSAVRCTEVPAQCKACMLMQVLSAYHHVLHTTQVPTQNMYIFSVFRSVLFALIPFCLTFHSTVYLHMQYTFF